MEAIAANRPLNDPGLTILEWADKLGHGVNWVRLRFGRLKAAGKLQMGRAQRENLTGTRVMTNVYRLKK